MQGEQAALVAGVHRFQEVDRSGAAQFTDHDPVRMHTQPVADQIAYGDRSPAFRIGQPPFQTQQVRVAYLHLAGFLYRENSVGRVSARGERAEQRRLAGTGTAGHKDVETCRDAGTQELRHVLGERAERHQILDGQPLARQLADDQGRSIHGGRRHGHVHVRAIGQASFD